MVAEPHTGFAQFLSTGLNNGSISLMKVERGLAPHIEPVAYPPDDFDYEYVIVFPERKRDAKEPEQDIDYARRVKRNEIIYRFARAGLRTILVSPLGGGEVLYLLVGAPDMLIETMAQVMKLEIPVKHQYGGGYEAYDRHQKKFFIPSREEFTASVEEEPPTKVMFSSLLRQRIIYNVMTSKDYSGAAAVDLDEQLTEHFIVKYFAKHNKVARDYLVEKWAKALFSGQPIARIRYYFGESVALFFAYLGYSTTFLLIAAVVGLPLFVVSRIINSQIPNIAYSLFLTIWATVFLSCWQRKTAALNHEWNMTNYSAREITRPAYHGQSKAGIEIDDVWIDIPGGALVNRYFSWKNRLFRLILSLVPVTFMISLVIGITIGVIVFRVWLLQTSIGTFGVYLGSAANAITILVFNYLYNWFAVKLTNWENHRTQNSYDNWLIIKMFLFQFVNSYAALYYTAFFKNGRMLFTDALEDRCQSDSLGLGCLEELTIQLGTIFVVNTLSNQFTLVLLPWIFQKIKNMGLLGNRIIPILPSYEDEARMARFNGNISKYMQVVIQYGYIVLFAAAFPPAPLIAIINNYWNIRIYTVQMLTLYNRPDYRGAKNIGVWYWIMELLSFSGVVTNCALIGYTNTYVKALLQSPLYVLISIVALEHLLIMVKLVLRVSHKSKWSIHKWQLIIPPVPLEVRKDIIKQEFIGKELRMRRNEDKEKKGKVPQNRKLQYRGSVVQQTTLPGHNQWIDEITEIVRQDQQPLRVEIHGETVEQNSAPERADSFLQLPTEAYGHPRMAAASSEHRSVPLDEPTESRPPASTHPNDRPSANQQSTAHQQNLLMHSGMNRPPHDRPSMMQSSNDRPSQPSTRPQVVHQLSNQNLTMMSAHPAEGPRSIMSNYRGPTERPQVRVIPQAPPPPPPIYTYGTAPRQAPNGHPNAVVQQGPPMNSYLTVQRHNGQQDFRR
ncbi:hypothetical protein PROFUN_06956 [Planoprotostelium fungivorum]|uniref:Anoctamin transmembrane domain-containing protein n=1 Tax=Planoprotostelium fungivorum TaxID=1890364 RepID=A0A2P6NN64_9EUKA|nr:hypothetical protein PROFUN_06956 [Planoprotostelium fungivorum]